MNIKTTTCACLTLLALSSFYSQPTLAKDNQLASSICGYVAADDSNRLRKKLKDHKIRLRQAYDGILCNGSSLLKFAIEEQANKTGEFITRKVSKKALSKAGPDGLIILDWAESSSYADSPIVKAIKKRI